MGAAVPADDLPSNLVPSSDMPSGVQSSATSAAPVTPTPAAAPVVPSEPQTLGQRAKSTAVDALDFAINSVVPWRAMKTVNDAVGHVAHEGGGKVAEYAGSKGLSPEVAGALGVGTNMAIEAVPMFIGGGAGRKVGEKAGEAIGERWMQQALQPSKIARESGDADKAIQWLLKADSNQLSKGGIERMTKMIDDLDDALTVAIKNAGDVSTLTVLQSQKRALEKLRFSTDQKISGPAIKEEFLKFLDLPDVQGALRIPAETAQAIKRQLYKDIGERGFQRATSEVRSAEQRGEEMGKKAVAEGLSDSLGRVSPEAAAINAQMSPAIKARDLVEERVSSHGNKMEAGHGWLARAINAGLGWMIDRSPYLKSLAAREMYRGTGGAAAGEVLGGAYGASTGFRPPEGKR